MSAVRVRAPASSANLGPGFDCAAVALELWNELEVTAGDGDPDLDHLGVRAFARLAPVEGRRFAFLDRIPRERGLGSSAAVIALGLTAANEVAGLGLARRGAPRGGGRARRPRRQPRGGARRRRLPHVGHEDRASRRRRAGGSDRARPGGDRLDGRRPRVAARRGAARGRRPSPPGAPRCSARRSRPDRSTSSRRPSPTASTSPTGPTARRFSRRCATTSPRARSAPPSPAPARP